MSKLDNFKIKNVFISLYTILGIIYFMILIKVKKLNKLFLIILFTLFIIKKTFNDEININIEPITSNFKYNKYFNYIPISYGLNNNNFYPTFISITSILENANNSTFYIFYLLVSKFKKNFSNKNKLKFKNIENNYKKCKINIIEINDNIFKYVNINRYPLPTYYRLLLAKLLPFLNRIIYLDGDTITYIDLFEMINLNMENNVIMGFIDDGYNYANLFGIKTYKYITAGVILINLEAINKENITNKFFNFIKKNKNLLIQEDQTVINIVLHGRIGILPCKFGIWSYFNFSELLFHNQYKNFSHNLKCYEEQELIKAWKYPGILHFVNNKPFLYGNYKLNFKFIKDWLYYANKTGLFKEIIKYYTFL